MQRTLGDGALRWTLAWEPGGNLVTTRIENQLTGSVFTPSRCAELTAVLSAAPDRIAQPLTRVSDFTVAGSPTPGTQSAVFRLRSPSSGLEAELRYSLSSAGAGASAISIRRKDSLVRNNGQADILLLDLVLDEITLEATSSPGPALSGGGQGQPLFIGRELFAAVEHPSGWNEMEGPTLRLLHCPGKRLAPGAWLAGRTAVFGAARAGDALPGFVQWIQERCLRLRRKTVSVYTPFGINNQWGLGSTLDDEQILHVLSALGGLRRRGAAFDFFTLDTGWVDYGSDLKRFRPVAFPEGPERLLEAVKALGMRFGLWFATSWAAMSCWDFASAWGSRPAPGLTWRNGNPAMADYAASFCLAAPPYFRILKDAVLHHVRANGARFLKFDGGTYACSDESHGHLPGRYAVELMHDLLIELSAAVRAEAPDAFIMWYWGLRSPFWALHGDTIFESGLFMEGSGTSAFPALHYRDSVTLAQDQNACHAATIPPVAKDSLGVWLADTRWGNFMGRERWREALVMDLGRGNLLFPNLWGDIYLLEDDDVRFLAATSRFARAHEDLLLAPRVLIGDAMSNGPYGYAYCRRSRGLVFLNNMHFAPREVSLELGPGIGLEAPSGRKLRLRSLFPDRARILNEQGRHPWAGQELRILLRPFEVLMLEVGVGPQISPLPRRDAKAAGRLGAALALRAARVGPDLDVKFADAERFSRQGQTQGVQAFEADLPSLDGPEQAILCVSVRLRKDDAEWKYAPTVCEIVQATARIEGHGDGPGERVLFAPVPDARQFGNTQKAGCSWVVYRTRMPRRWSGARMRLAVHAFLPAGVTALVEAWVVRRWWQESARPVADAWYADAPS